MPEFVCGYDKREWYRVRHSLLETAELVTIIISLGDKKCGGVDHDLTHLARLGETSPPVDTPNHTLRFVQSSPRF